MSFSDVGERPQPGTAGYAFHRRAPRIAKPKTSPAECPMHPVFGVAEAVSRVIVALLIR